MGGKLGCDARLAYEVRLHNRLPSGERRSFKVGHSHLNDEEIRDAGEEGEAG